MGKNIEVENGELALENEFGDIVIVPRKYAMEVRDMVKDNCNNCIDALASELPTMENYAEDGTVIPADQTDTDPPQGKKKKKRLSRSFFRPEVKRESTAVGVDTKLPDFNRENKYKKKPEPKEKTDLDIKLDEMLENPIKKEKKKIEPIQTSADDKPKPIRGVYKTGNRGKDVEYIQKKLVDSGILGAMTEDNKNNVDGIYGNNTAEAVKKFQKKHGLKVDGIVGRETLNKMSQVKAFEPKPEIQVRESDNTSIQPQDIKPLEKMDTRRMRYETDVIEDIKNTVPLAVRQFVDDTFRFDTPITMKNMNRDEYSALISAVEHSLKSGKKVLDYDTWRAIGSGGEDTRQDDMNLFNPASSLQKTLGQAAISIDDKGDIYVKDTYNFNDAGDKKNRNKNSLTDENGLLPLDEATSISNKAYRIARNFKTLTGRADEGSESNIYVGNISEYSALD